MPRGQATGVHATLGWAMASLVALIAPQASAQSGVVWHAPAECPSATQAAAEIERLRAHGPSAPVQAHVEIQRESASHLRARVAVRADGRAQEQVLRDADCAALTRAAALVVAMAMEPSAASSRGPKPHASSPLPAAAADSSKAGQLTETSEDQPKASAERAPDPQPSAASEPAQPLTAAKAPEPAPSSERIVLPVPLPERRSASPGPHVTLTSQPMAANRRDRAEPPEPADSASSQPPLRGFLGLAGGLSSGIVPQLAPSALLSAGILTHRLRAALRFGYVPSQHAWLDAAATTGGHVALTSAAAEAGLRLYPLTPLEVPLYAGLETGLFSADADGVNDHSARREAWLALFAGSGLALTWDRLVAVALRAEGVVALRRPSFALASADGAERLVFHQPSALGVRVYLSLELQFL